MPGTRVLLVDDEIDYVVTLAERLEARGIEVDVVHTGEDAIERVRAAPYDAIVLDVVMPGIDGIGTLTRVLELRPDMQVILLTGKATIETGVEAMKRGAADFMQKPADLGELMEKVQKAANKRMMLVEKRAEAEVADILMRKGW